MTEEAVSLSRKVYGLLGATFLSTLRSTSSQLAPCFPLDLKITIDIFWVGAVWGFLQQSQEENQKEMEWRRPTFWRHKRRRKAKRRVLFAFCKFTLRLPPSPRPLLRQCFEKAPWQMGIR